MIPPMIRMLVLLCLREALRGGLPLALGGLWLLAAGVAELAAALVPTGSHDMRLLTFAALARVLTVFVLTVFVVTTLRREADDRVQAWWLALDRPRHHYLAGRALGGLAVALGAAAMLTLLLLPFAPVNGALVWGSGLACELALMVLLAQAVALALDSPALGLAAVMVSYVLARAIDGLRLLANAPLLDGSGAWLDLARLGLDALAWIVPALARFAPGAVLLAEGGAPSTLAYVLPQTLVTALILWAVMRVDFARRSW
jgi:hypothetical protein